MNTNLEISNLKLSMSSREIADLTDKENSFLMVPVGTIKRAIHGSLQWNDEAKKDIELKLKKVQEHELWISNLPEKIASFSRNGSDLEDNHGNYITSLLNFEIMDLQDLESEIIKRIFEYSE